MKFDLPSNALLKKCFTYKTLVVGSLFLVGCNVAGIKINTDTPNAYLLNPNTGAFCKGFLKNEKRSACVSLLPVAFHHAETREIENIYQQKIIGANRPAGMIKIMLNGENLDYQAKELESGIYKLPMNQQTNTVWRVLKRIDQKTYLEN